MGLIPLDREQRGGQAVKVGDKVRTDQGWEADITQISVCLRPHADPAGETHSHEVDEVELCLPFVADLSNGKWVYAHQLAEIVTA
jgi:hypothetical protein